MLLQGSGAAVQEVAHRTHQAGVVGEGGGAELQPFRKGGHHPRLDLPGQGVDEQFPAGC